MKRRHSAARVFGLPLLMLLLAGLLLPAGPAPVARAQTLAPLMPFLPTLSRSFTPADHVRTYVRVYRRARTTTGTMRLSVRPVDRDDPIWTATPPITFTKDDDAGIVTDLPLASWRPGDYRLSVTLENQQAAVVEQRFVDFELLRVGGVKFTIKDGIVYEAKQLLADVAAMVEKQKKERAAKPSL